MYLFGKRDQHFQLQALNFPIFKEIDFEREYILDYTK